MKEKRKISLNKNREFLKKIYSEQEEKYKKALKILGREEPEFTCLGDKAFFKMKVLIDADNINLSQEEKDHFVYPPCLYLIRRYAEADCKVHGLSEEQIEKEMQEQQENKAWNEEHEKEKKRL